MADWIEYDGTNKPGDDVLVRVRLFCGYEDGPNDWDEAGGWDWSVTELSRDHTISHFQLKDKEND